MNQIIGVIPARYGSTRFPGKPLHPIHGKPMIQWTIEGAKKSKMLTSIIVATDHSEILKISHKCGVEAVLTPSELASGTDRVYDAVKNKPCDVVVNIQGDEPLIEGSLIDLLVDGLLHAENCMMASLCHPLISKDLNNPDIVKVIENQNQEAIYFSRFPIPFSKAQPTENQDICFRHIGLYAFRKSFLKTFCETAPTELEKSESLEQLRALHLGARIKMIHVDHYTQGVDRPDDIARVEKLWTERQSFVKTSSHDSKKI